MGDDPLSGDAPVPGAPGAVPEPPALPVRTERLLLRAARLDDAVDMAAYYGDREVSRRLVQPSFDLAQVEAMLRARVSSDNPWTLEVVLEHEGRVVGDLVLFLERPLGSSAEVGWVLAPASGGRGLATEGTAALLDLAFDHYGVDRVHADPDAGNVASIALAERLGMTLEGETRDGRGRRYAVLSQEWRRARRD